MNHHYKFGILAAWNSLLLGRLIEMLAGLKGINCAVLIDGGISPKNLALFQDRILPEKYPPPIEQQHLPQVPFYFLGNHCSKESISFIKENGFDYLLNGGVNRILTTDLLNATKGVLNSHPGLLPKYRGSCALEWSILNSDPVGGTLHFMTDKVDDGPILFSEKLPVKKYQSYREVRTEMLTLQARLLVRGMVELNNGSITPSTLKEQGPGLFHKPISKDLLETIQFKLTNGEYICEVET